MAATDPFTQVYQAIWTALTQHPDWSALVSASNQIRFDGQADPVKYQRQPSDLPEAVLLQSRFNFSAFTTSSRSTDITQTYPLAMTNADLNLTNVNALKWHTMRALIACDPNGRLNLGGIVRSFTVTDGRSDPLMSTGKLDRWETVLVINVLMTIDRAALIANTL